MLPYYNDFGSWIRNIFPFKIQKISIDAGFSCPNRDGTISFGGCTFCNNDTFSPAYCNKQKTITKQLNEGKAFFKEKYPNMKYIAYFQAYTNTYGSLEQLKKKYEEALANEDIVGIVIGTRPDCMSDDLLSYLTRLSKQTFVIVEYGVESVNDNTLYKINRGHDFECSKRIITSTAEKGIITGAHVILGLPGETKETDLQQAEIISQLPIKILKIHQLQVIKGTSLAKDYIKHPFHLYTVDEYLHLLTEYIQRLRTDIVLDRFTSQSPGDLLIAPKWGLKNYQFTNLLLNKLKKEQAWQGKLCNRY